MSGVSGADAGTGVAGLRPSEVGPFLARLVRLDPAALVRLRPAVGDRARPASGAAVTAWGRMPWGVLAARTVSGTVAGDLTVSAAALLDLVSTGGDRLPGRRDGDWRWPVPATMGEAVESVPAADLVRLGAAAARTLRSGQGRVGERVLRDALLDHVAIAVRTAAGVAVEVRQGLVQAALRMGLVTTDDNENITVRTVGKWVGLTSRDGEVWQQTGTSLAVRIVR
jgi:hypothetical protein